MFLIIDYSFYFNVKKGILTKIKKMVTFQNPKSEEIVLYCILEWFYF